MNVSNKNILQDKYGRTIDYVRLAVTDKCNLRCFYCMPQEGISFVKKDELLSYEEILRIVQILSTVGVSKIRITGGEPFLRKDIMSMFNGLANIEAIKKIAVTTNGTLTEKYLDELLNLGVENYNLSIDSIDKKRFNDITRRDSFDTVWSCYETMLSKGIIPKLNCVVMDDRNIDDIIPMVELGKDHNVSVRFIEEMPFNGDGHFYKELKWDYKQILNHIKIKYPQVSKLEDPKNSTSFNYKVDGFKGTFGIIPAYTRSFCGSCNRLRITPTGLIKTCLYDEGVFNIKDVIRAGATDDQVLEAIRSAVGNKAKDGFEAEKGRQNSGSIGESMATIGG